MKARNAILNAALALFAASVANAADTSTMACCAKAVSLAATNLTERSLFQTASKWTTDAGKQLTLGDLRGKPQVVAMFLARCQYACPIIVNDMKRIEALLTAEQRARVGFTLVSFDTQRDTVEALAAYRRTHDLPAGLWTLLRGRADDVLELAELLGVRYKQDSTGQFSHSNIITVLNADGEVVHQQIGLNQDINATVRTIAKLVAK